jgi:hypothetical protein
MPTSLNAKDESVFDRETIEQLKFESANAAAVLRVVRGMRLNPSAGAPVFPALPVFWRSWLYFTVTAFTLAACVHLAWHLTGGISQWYRQYIYAMAGVYSAFIGPIISYLIAIIARLLSGEQITHDAYNLRVLHDHTNAMMLREFSEKTLKQAGAQIKRNIDQLGDIRTFMLTLLGSVAALMLAMLTGAGISKSSNLYEMAAGVGALAAPLVLIGHFFAFRPLPRLRYWLSIIEIAQNIERKELRLNAASSSDSVQAGRGGLLRKVWHTIVAVDRWLAGKKITTELAHEEAEKKNATEPPAGP